jgi:hypothetical protein
MPANYVYFLDPEPDGLTLIEILNLLRQRGFGLSYSTKDVLLMENVKQLLKDQGARQILSRQLLAEEMLPDNAPRALLLDTLNYKLDRCAPKASMLIIDPYLYPDTPDASYENDLMDVLRRVVGKIATLRVATLRNRNASLEGRIDASIRTITPNIRIERKYTNVFHDRFWIADDARRLFLGTSLSGIGKRYALIDYLSDEDANEIVQRYKSIP